MKILVILVLLLVSRVVAGDLIFNVNDENRDYLRYFMYANRFDSSKVTLTFGEFSLVNNYVTTRILLEHPFDSLTSKWIQADSMQGISYDLENVSKSEPFTIIWSPGAKIRFFRMTDVSANPCNQWDVERPPEDWGLLDQTEFVMNLIDLSSGLPVATIDSVGSKATDTENEPLYGSDFDKCFHEWTYPGGLILQLFT